MIEINYTLTAEYAWSGEFSDLPDELRTLISAMDSVDPDDLAELIEAEITDVDLSHLVDTGAELQSEAYEVDSVTVD